MAQQASPESVRATTTYRVLALTEIRAATWSRIYSQGLATGNASFITRDPPSWSQFDSLVIKRHRLIASHPRDNRLLGWVCALPAFPSLSLGLDDGPSRRRTAGGTLEVLVFVAEGEWRTNVGTQLMGALEESLRKDARWSALQATIFPENQAAAGFFAKNGFAEVARRSRVGKMRDGPSKGQWRDVVTLEKRLVETEDQDQSDAETDASPQERSSVQGSPDQLPTAESISASMTIPNELYDTKTVDPAAVVFKRPRLE